MDNSYAIVDMKLGRKGAKIEVNYRLLRFRFDKSPFQIVDMDLLLKLEDMHVEMDCLFPRR